MIETPYSDDEIRELRQHWELDPDTTFLNHGSFGLQPRSVQEAFLDRHQQLVRQPMDFYLQQYETRLHATRDRVADFVGTASSDLVLVENATYGMNVVARSMPLAPGDEVVTTSLSYGAVERCWQRRCEQSGARLVVAEISLPIIDSNTLVEQLLVACTSRTRLIVVSHLTSGTALWMPVTEIIAAAHARGIRVAIDGPHAVGLTDLRLTELGCDYYVASCHKWLCAPLGTGFLYVRPDRQAEIKPLVTSWGRIEPAEPSRWQDEFTWSGTSNPSARLTIPVAIDFLSSLGWQRLRTRCHALAQYARAKMEQLTGLPPICPDELAWYGPMTTCRLPPFETCGIQGDSIATQCHELRARLRREYDVIIQVVAHDELPYIRFSCHVYTTEQEIDTAIEAIRELLL